VLATLFTSKRILHCSKVCMTSVWLPEHVQFVSSEAFLSFQDII